MKYLNYQAKSKNWLFSVFFLCVSLSYLLGQSGRPNIILINADDLGWKDLGIYGSSFYETPNIDALARSGMLFTQAYSAAANCAPSRACMLTGLQTPRHGIYTVGTSERGNPEDRRLVPVQNTTVLSDSFITLLDYMQTLDYYTISIGKWHLAEDPRSYGVDENIAGNRGGHPRSYFSPYQNRNLPDGPDGEFLTDRLTDEAIRFLERKHEENFFLYLPYFAVHTPLMAKEEKIEKYRSRQVDPGQDHAVYAAMIESLDENVGRLMQALTALELRSNTLVIFTSDNGGICHISSQRPLRAGKGSYYEGGIRVPLIFSWPGQIEKSSICDDPVTNLDFFPTLIDLLSKGDESSHPQLDGHSLLPVLLNGEPLPPRPLYWHFPIYLESYAGIHDEARDTLFRTRPGMVVRFGEWKLHEYFEDNTFELYHLGLDPSEQKNLSEIYPEKRDILYSLMKKWREEMNAPVPEEQNPLFKP
ncbi:MAG: sulfatase [Saprospiraceae bacterium]|nr:sulfatase [Saprospiraceae bacterium]